MVQAMPSFLFVHTYYPEFLQDLYAHDAGLATLDFERQRQRIFQTFFGVSDAYSHGLHRLGCEAQEVIANADRLQGQWALEHGVALNGNIHDQRRQVVAAQIRHYRPEVLYIFEWNPLGDAFVADVKSQVQLTVGQIASPLPPNRTFAAYDLMISSFPPIVDHFAQSGGDAAMLALAFDGRILDRLPAQALGYDVTFVGGFAPSHPDRIRWLEQLNAQVPVEVFGYGRDKIEASSPLAQSHRGEAWGLRMYEVLAQSRLTLNRHAHIDVRGSIVHRHANNMRLYEATGVGTCLVTEHRDNLATLFDPEGEVVAYRDTQECVEKLRYLLEHPRERDAIASAGQRRTLEHHTYQTRMADLLQIIRARL